MYKFCTTTVLGSDLAYPCTYLYLYLYILVEPLHKLFTGSCTSFAQPLHCGKSCTRRKTGKNIFGLPCSSPLLLVVTSNVLSAGEMLKMPVFFYGGGAGEEPIERLFDQINVISENTLFESIKMEFSSWLFKIFAKHVGIMNIA